MLSSAYDIEKQGSFRMVKIKEIIPSLEQQFSSMGHAHPC